MCKKYVGLLLFVLTTMMFVGCAEDPYDWSGDSERTVPIPVDLSLEVVGDIVTASCIIEFHDDDLPILETGFFYGKSSNVNYDIGERVKVEWSGNKFETYYGIPIYFDTDNQLSYCYVGAYITTSKGMVTIGPKRVEKRWSN